MTEVVHQPVMLAESLTNLNLKEAGTFVDATFGNGGHSLAFLKSLNSEGKLIAFEWDQETAEIYHDQRFNFSNFFLIKNNFACLESELKKINVTGVDGVFFDLGISSYQLAQDSRGFSYRLDSPLDMRIDKQQKLTAEKVINDYSAERLADIFFYYGEERKSRLIAKKICRARSRERIISTQQLVSIVASCFPKKGKKHPAKRVFQALRIFVNQELENLTQALDQALNLLNKGGRIVVISFHSLEDRIVKKKFKEVSLTGEFKLITKKPLIPSDSEITDNNRSRSAKMRVIERVE